MTKQWQRQGNVAAMDGNVGSMGMQCGAGYDVGRNLGRQLCIINIFVVYIQQSRPYRTIFIGKSLTFASLNQSLTFPPLNQSLTFVSLHHPLAKTMPNVGAIRTRRCDMNYSPLIYDWWPKLASTSYLARIAPPNAPTQWTNTMPHPMPQPNAPHNAPTQCATQCPTQWTNPMTITTMKQWQCGGNVGGMWGHVGSMLGHVGPCGLNVTAT